MADKPNSERDRPNLIVRVQRGDLDRFRKLATRHDMTLTDLVIRALLAEEKRLAHHIPRRA